MLKLEQSFLIAALLLIISGSASAQFCLSDSTCGSQMGCFGTTIGTGCVAASRPYCCDGTTYCCHVIGYECSPGTYCTIQLSCPSAMRCEPSGCASCGFLEQKVGGYSSSSGLDFSVAQSSAAPPLRILKITYVETTRRPDGKIIHMGERVRLTHVATGQYRETAYGPDVTSDNFMLVSTRGVFVIGKTIQPKDEYRAPYPESFLPETVKNGAIGTAQIAGYTAYIKKSSSGLFEVWTAPQFGTHVPLKQIFYGAEGSFTQLEAKTISEETAPPNFFDLPDLPMDLSKLEASLQAAQERNDQAAISRFTALLKKWKR